MQHSSTQNLWSFFTHLRIKFKQFTMVLMSSFIELFYYFLLLWTYCLLFPTPSPDLAIFSHVHTSFKVNQTCSNLRDTVLIDLVWKLVPDFAWFVSKRKFEKSSKKKKEEVICFYFVLFGSCLFLSRFMCCSLIYSYIHTLFICSITFYPLTVLL